MSSRIQSSLHPNVRINICIDEFVNQNVHTALRFYDQLPFAILPDGASFSNGRDRIAFALRETFYTKSRCHRVSTSGLRLFRSSSSKSLDSEFAVMKQISQNQREKGLIWEACFGEYNCNAYLERGIDQHKERRNTSIDKQTPHTSITTLTHHAP